MFNTISSFSKLSKVVELGLGANIPMIIDYKINPKNNQNKVLMEKTKNYKTKRNSKHYISQKRSELPRSRKTKKTKIYQASTSELYGKVQETPQKETTPFYPRSPYGVAKLYAYWITKNYRESYGMFAVNGILFNHESERRGETFVSRKISLAAARIATGTQNVLYLGNLNAKRDWGYAKDYVKCMWLMLQHPTPEDFVIASGRQHTVRRFCELAFAQVGIELHWEGKGQDEKGICQKTGKTYIKIDPKYYRPAEVETLLGDPTKAKTVLGWDPEETPFETLVKRMVKSDLVLAQNEQSIKKSYD